MDGRQTLVGAAGAGLILLNFWSGEARTVVSGGLFGGGDTNAAHGQLKVLGGELVFLIVAVLLAGISDAWASAMIALVVVLAVLFAINHPHPLSKGPVKP